MGSSSQMKAGRSESQELRRGSNLAKAAGDLPVVSDELTPRLEDELVLLCARTRIDAETSARVKAITSSPDDVDWDYVYQLARRHSVLPLVYRQLSTIAASKVPPDQL